MVEYVVTNLETNEEESLSESDFALKYSTVVSMQVADMSIVTTIRINDEKLGSLMIRKRYNHY